MNAEDYLSILRLDIIREGLSEDQLQIVDSIYDYCRRIGHPEWESSEDRIAKCLHLTVPPLILLKREIDLRLHSLGLIPLIERKFPDADIALLNDNLTFVRHLLHHEIVHMIRRKFHAKMTAGEVERDCDQWAFQRIKEPNKPPQPTPGSTAAERG